MRSASALAGSGLVALALLGPAACSSASTPGAPSSGPYPSVPPDIGQIVNQGGTLLTSPKIVTVTWTADPNEAALETFGDQLGASAYWAQAVGEYGVGPATSGAANHVRVPTAPPAAIEVTDLETWFSQQVLDPATSSWPAWDDQTSYVVYVPTATHLTSGGADTCQQHASLHSEVSVGDHPVSYVFIDESCNGSLSVLDGATSAAAHEIVEDVTNPYPYSSRAYIGFDAQHLAWALLDGEQDDELGDTCEGLSDAVFTGPADLPFALQRVWSNASAAAGHSPCVPQSPEPYFNVTPLAQETLGVLVGVAQTPATALGYEVPAGTSKTFDVSYYSDAPTGLWNLAAVEGNGVTPPDASHVTLSVARGEGANGHQDRVTVTVDSAPDGGNAILVTLVSSAQGHTTHYFPVLIGAY
ncbi:MAG: hypothetical protein ACRELB_14680 [Polyangiaceae bacterium]